MSSVRGWTWYTQGFLDSVFRGVLSRCEGEHMVLEIEARPFEKSLWSYVLLKEMVDLRTFLFVKPCHVSVIKEAGHFHSLTVYT